MYQRRFVAYAHMRGLEPDDLASTELAGDYMRWIGRNLADFRKQHPESFIGNHLNDQDAFTRHLERLVDERLTKCSM